MAGTKDRREAAASLRLLVAQVDGGKLDSPRWLVERLRGAIVALEA
ncbi:MAG: hypothetical protein ACRDQZ_03195 [Mycobacteriales bacterium]